MMNKSTIWILAFVLVLQIYKGSADFDLKCVKRLMGKFEGKFKEIKGEKLHECYNKENLQEVKSIYKNFADKVPDYCKRPKAKDDVKKCITFYIDMFKNQTETAEIKKAVHKLLEGGQNCTKVFLKEFEGKNVLEIIQKTCAEAGS
ncbi:uncharacterized protein LOC143200044 [Rhynchophorus ferrugineus]|uniref:Uncharacterized protein n=1 Tax=Rhynchophorus ferrugineus TaxID=354439 RepID=A0A834I6D5_RHYFE|nr:hypothetical protein GWI33_013795 [Rhynchophorus ferrugineus]